MLPADICWAVRPSSTAAYTTRLVVYRPSDPANFNGTVVVEWLDASGGADVSADWIKVHIELIRNGFAWVGVSAQAVGVEGPIVGTNASGPIGGSKAIDPARYASRDHPGDSYSYDIFSQAGLAVRHRNGPDPLAGLQTRRVIAVGCPQSADRIATHVNSMQPLAHIFDGFLVHSRSLAAGNLSDGPQPVAVPNPWFLLAADAKNLESAATHSAIGIAR